MLKLFSLVILLLLSFSSSAAVLPAGTEIKVRTEEPVNTQLRRLGYQFRARVDGDVIVNNQVVVKDGAKALAKVSKVKNATRNTEAEVEVTLTTLYINRNKHQVPSYPVGGKGELKYPRELGSKNLDQDEMTSSSGQTISNTIPVSNKDNYVQINQNTVIYFITAQDVDY